MGMAASQARLLSITARMSNNEFEQQSIAYSKQRLSDNSGRINDEYLDALNKTKYQVLTGYNGTEACYADITYNQLTGCNSVASGKQYLVKDNSGKVLVSNALANAFKAGNGDFNIFLRKLGYTQSDIDTSKSGDSEEAIHEAWDKYLNSVGKSIYDVNGNTSESEYYEGEHILGFGYKSLGTEQFNGIPTYNSAYAVNQNPAQPSFYAYKDSEGYYTNKNAVVARNYTDAAGETKTGVFYQTASQIGSNDYTQLLDVTYDANLILSDNLLNILNSQVTNYRRFKWAHYDKEGITFTKDVKSKDCTETITLYNKEKEICTSHNKDFLNSLSQPQSVIDYFKGKTRFEITLNTVKKIMNYLNLTDTKIFSVLNSDTNPILTQFDKVFGNSTANMPNTTFDDYENWAMKIILERYNGDLKLLEQDIRSKFNSRSGASKRMKKFETVYHAMTSASTSENPIEKIRNLLL